MHKHLNRFVLLIGLIILVIALVIMMSQTVGSRQAKNNSTNSVQNTFAN